MVLIVWEFNKRSIKLGENLKENVCKILLILNICIICFFKYLFPGPTQNSEISLMFMVLLIVNISSIILLFNNKIRKNILVIVCIVILNSLLTIGLPVYKLEGHEHVFNENREQIIYYIDYYNAYGIKLHRENK
jgi:hypothetical protein